MSSLSRPTVNMVKNTHRLFFPLHVVEVGGGKQARSQGGLQKVPFLATKWTKNGVILVGLGLGP